jgi:hypothetical protein
MPVSYIVSDEILYSLTRIRTDRVGDYRDDVE